MGGGGGGRRLSVGVKAPMMIYLYTVYLDPQRYYYMYNVKSMLKSMNSV